MSVSNLCLTESVYNVYEQVLKVGQLDQDYFFQHTEIFTNILNLPLEDDRLIEMLSPLISISSILLVQITQNSKDVGQQRCATTKLIQTEEHIRNEDYNENLIQNGSCDKTRLQNLYTFYLKILDFCASLLSNSSFRARFSHSFKDTTFFLSLTNCIELLNIANEIHLVNAIWKVSIRSLIISLQMFEMKKLKSISHIDQFDQAVSIFNALYSKIKDSAIHIGTNENNSQLHLVTLKFFMMNFSALLKYSNVLFQSNSIFSSCIKIAVTFLKLNSSDISSQVKEKISHFREYVHLFYSKITSIELFLQFIQVNSSLLLGNLDDSFLIDNFVGFITCEYAQSLMMINGQSVSLCIIEFLVKIFSLRFSYFHRVSNSILALFSLNVDRFNDFFISLLAMLLSSTTSLFSCMMSLSLFDLVLPHCDQVVLNELFSLISSRLVYFLRYSPFQFMIIFQLYCNIVSYLKLPQTRFYLKKMSIEGILLLLASVNHPTAIASLNSNINIIVGFLKSLISKICGRNVAQGSSLFANAILLILTRLISLTPRRTEGLVTKFLISNCPDLFLDKLIALSYLFKCDLPDTIRTTVPIYSIYLLCEKCNIVTSLLLNEDILYSKLSPQNHHYFFDMISITRNILKKEIIPGGVQIVNAEFLLFLRGNHEIFSRYNCIEGLPEPTLEFDSSLKPQREEDVAIAENMKDPIQVESETTITHIEEDLDLYLNSLSLFIKRANQDERREIVLKVRRIIDELN